MMNSRLLKDYNISRLLGAGSFGAVIQCTHKLEGKNYAVKVAAADDAAVQEIQNFVKIPNHRNLVQYYTCWEDSLSKTAVDEIGRILKFDKNVAAMFSTPSGSNCFDVMCIQMELCGPDLRSVLKESKVVNSQKVMNIFIQLLQGIEHIHNHGIIHRDLKPENIFTCARDPKVVKIGDLGIATSHGAAATVTRTKSAGTQLYLAPEQASSKYGKSVDIYALGIIFLEMLNPTVQPAFNQNSLDKLVDMVITLKFRQVVPDSVQKNWPIAARTIQKMTIFDVSERPTCKEIFNLFSKSLESNSYDSKPSAQKLEQRIFQGMQSTAAIPKSTPNDSFRKLVEDMKSYDGKDKEEKLIDLVTQKAFKNNNWLDIIFRNFPQLLDAKFGASNYSFLHYAAENNELKATRYFIERRLNVNKQDKHSNTPLQLAAKRGYDKIAKSLLKAGADPNICHIIGWTPLHYAAINNHVEVGSVLLSYNANPSIKTNFEMITALDLAKANGYTKFIKLLTKHQDKTSK